MTTPQTIAKIGTGGKVCRTPTPSGIARALGALKVKRCKVRIDGQAWSARCPACERDDVLKLDEGARGEAMVRCLRGCTLASVCAALKLTIGDLAGDVDLPRKKARRASRSKATDLRPHPAAAMFPPLEARELQALADDITQNGLHHPIVIHEGVVLDGVNRLAACRLAGVEPQTVEWGGRGSPVSFVVSANLRRRHLTPSQTAMIATDLLPLLEAEAKERRLATLKKGDTLPDREIVPGRESGKASEHAATLCQTNARYVSDAKRIAAESPTLAERIRKGELSIPSAKKMLDPLPRTDAEMFEEASRTAFNKATRAIDQVAALLDRADEIAKTSPADAIRLLGQIQAWALRERNRVAEIECRASVRMGELLAAGVDE